MRKLARIVAVAVPLVVVLGTSGTAMAKSKVAPPVLTEKPANPTVSTSATFAWTEATAGVTFTCKLDAAVAAACTSPKAYTGLKAGTHSFQVKASRTGYIAATTSYSWRINTTPPAAPVVKQVPTPTNSTSASVSWTEATAGVTFTCKLDAAVAAACTSPKVLTDLSQGSHTLVVTARNAAGGTASGQTTWVVDTTPPAAPVVTGPATPTMLQTADVSWTGTGTSYSCTVDGGTAAACTSPLSLSGLAEGPHSVVVTAKDAVGNVSDPGSAVWVVDLTPPAVPTLVSAPASPTNQTSATVRFSDLDQSAATYTCKLDSAAAAACTSPWTSTTILGNGSHTLLVVASDLAGNPSTALTVTWTVDTTSPTPPAFSAGPGTPTNDGNPTFSFASGDGSTVAYTCSLDGGLAAPCVSGAAFAASTQGAHNLAVRALDAVPNTSAPAVWNWVYDSVPPAAPTATTATSGVVGKTAPAVGFTTSDVTVKSFTCQVDSGSQSACTSGFTPTVTDGAHTISVRAVDAAGNVGDPLVFSFTVDTVAPTGTLTAPLSVAGPATMTFSEDVQGVTASTVRLYLGGTQVPATVACLSSSNAAAPCTGAVRSARVTPVKLLVPGQHYTVLVTTAVHDLAGNAAAVTPGAFRGTLVQQESSTALAQTWRVVSNAGALGGRYIVSDTAGAVASFPFRGTSITWYGTSGPSFGVARVYLDGVNKGLVNTYAATTKYRVPHTLTGLTGGSVIHRLQVVPTGVKGAVSGTGALVAFDAVKLGTTTVTNPVSTNRWGRFASAPSSGGGYAAEDQAGAVTVMAFRGTSISWTTVTGTTMGWAQVWIDGVLKGTYDNYATSTHYGVKRTWATTDAVHTVKLVVLGTHRAGGKGNRVILDALTVG